MNAPIPSSPRRERFPKTKGATGQIAGLAWPWLLGVALAIGVLALSPLAGASVAQEEQAGSRLLGELESGKLSCKDASGADFDHIGEYVMGRMFASQGGHESMNRLMSSMMGSGGEQAMHEAMGRRFAGCPGGRLPMGFGRMMGGGMMSGFGPGWRGGGPGNMMGGPGARGWNGPGGMMGGFWPGREGNDSSEGPSTAVMIVMAAILLVVMAVAIGWSVVRLRRGTPIAILKQRYAAGEISEREYRELRDALG